MEQSPVRWRILHRRHDSYLGGLLRCRHRILGSKTRGRRCEPEVGILLPPFTAAAIGLTLVAGAYLTEIMRGGFESVNASELEAAEVLGFSRPQVVRHVTVPHLMRTLFAPLSSFFIWMVLGSSIAALIGVEELTGRAINVSSETLRTIEVFVLVALDLLLLDEVTAALDPELVHEVLDTIRTLAAGGMTMLLVSHEMHFVREIADVVVMIDAGRIVKIGPAETIFDAPKADRTGSFMARVRRG